MSSTNLKTVLPGCAAVAVGGAYWAGMSSQSQLLGSFPNVGKAQQRGAAPSVALTFDDGPNEPYTSRLLEILAQRGVHATFFQVGTAVARFPDTSREVIAAGHTVGHHSHTHRLHRCFTRDAVDDELTQADDVFADVLGRRPKLYRPPWLVRTRATFDALRQRDMHPVSGTFCHPLEVLQPAGARIARRAIRRTSPGRILIFHDGYDGGTAPRSATLDAVARTVDALADRGYSFATVNALLGVDPYRDAGPRREPDALSST